MFVKIILLNHYQYSTKKYDPVTLQHNETLARKISITDLVIVFLKTLHNVCLALAVWEKAGYNLVN